MKNTTDNKPRDYIFFYNFDEGAVVIKNADSFKDAVYKLCEYEGRASSLSSGGLFATVLKGFDNNDIDGIISLYNRYSRHTTYGIDKVYLIDKKVYGREEDNLW